MKTLFVDTSGWVACADGSDRDHRNAVTARDRWLENGGVLVSTDYVADETLTLLRMRLGLAVAESWWDQVDSSPRVKWESIGEERAEKARSIFFRYTDKEFSFTDCTSFAVMRDLKLTNALTTDSHFMQAGFTMHPSKNLTKRR